MTADPIDPWVQSWLAGKYDQSGPLPRLPSWENGWTDSGWACAEIGEYEAWPDPLANWVNRELATLFAAIWLSGL